MSGNWIAKAHLKKGAFTKEAKAAGDSVQGFASKVSANPSRYSPKTRKRAALARTFARMNKRAGR